MSRDQGIVRAVVVVVDVVLVTRFFMTVSVFERSLYFYKVFHMELTSTIAYIVVVDKFL